MKPTARLAESQALVRVGVRLRGSSSIRVGVRLRGSLSIRVGVRLRGRSRIRVGVGEGRNGFGLSQ